MLLVVLRSTTVQLSHRLRRRCDEDDRLLEVSPEQRARLGVVGARLLGLERRDLLVGGPCREVYTSGLLGRVLFQKLRDV